MSHILSTSSHTINTECVRTYIFQPVQTSVYVHTYSNLYKQVCTYIHIPTCTNKCVHTYIFQPVQTSVYVHTYSNLYKQVCTYIHVHIPTCTNNHYNISNFITSNINVILSIISSTKVVSAETLNTPYLYSTTQLLIPLLSQSATDTSTLPLSY